MAWEDLEQDIAEEFSDVRNAGWASDGFIVRSFYIRKRPDRNREAATRRHRSSDATYQRGKRARRRWLRVATGQLSVRCERPGCFSLLQPMKRGAPQRFCSRACKDWRPAKPHVTRQCSQCPAMFTTHGRRTTCSNACRQRAWYYRRAGTAGASAGRGATRVQE